MNFNEAMEKLKQGKKVTRSTDDKSYFIMKDNKLEYRSRSTNYYLYSQDIMISEDWYFDNDDKTDYEFSEIIPFLLKGFKFKLKGWQDAYIYYDLSTQLILLITMVICDYIPCFADFIAEDWIEIT